jgi:hypothetical protein
VSSGLDALRLKKALATLHGIEQSIQDKQRWMATLSSFKGNPIDAGNLLEISNKLMQESMVLERKVLALASEAKSLSRSLPSQPPKQLTMTKYSASTTGELKELQAVAARMPKKMAELRRSLLKFRDFAMNKMNDPTRTSDGQPMDPGGLLLALLDLFVKARNL